MPLTSRLKRSRIAVAVSIAALFALAAPAGAGAAAVVNGDFEAGNLSGWQVSDSEPNGDSWYAYSGTSVEVPGGGPIIQAPAPPQGSFAAITVQGGEGRHILYQDVALELNWTHQLSLTAYYVSDEPLITADSLDPGNVPNQQYRIDVMRPTAPLDSINPADVLATIFNTKTGDPQTMAATQFGADLTAFAGQTVRLRMAEVDNQGPFNAGVDAVSILSTPPSNAITFGKPRLNKKKGTAKLPLKVPGPGTLIAQEARGKSSATASASKKRRVKKVRKTAAAAGTVLLPITPTKAGRKILEKKNRLRVKLSVSFTPTGGFAAAKTKGIVLKLNSGAAG